jgi:hypothetical protein
MNEDNFCRRRFRRLTMLGVLAGLGWAVPASPACAGLTALVPAYFYPAGAGLTDWYRLDAAAKSISLDVIVNPDSGPGPSQNPDYVSAIDNLRAAGGKTFGYVDTDYGNRSEAAVLADVNNFTTFYHLDGVFLDQMSTDPAKIGYYQDIYTSIKSADPAFRVIANPGTPPPESYVSASPRTADTFVIYENDNQASSYTSFSPPAYVNRYGSDRFASIVYNAASSSTMLDDLKQAPKNNTGSIFVTDLTLPNPYSALPSYWDQEVQSLEPLPEPSTAALAAVGFTALLAAAGHSWRRMR